MRCKGREQSNMNVFLRELKAHRTALIIWSFGVILMIASSMGKYAGLSASGQSVNDLLAQMPQSLKAVMGMGTFDLTTASGYYGVLFIYVVLMTTIHSAMLGANIIAKEERDRTAEFLFIKPISRSSAITSKLLAAFVNISIINLLTLVTSIILVQNYSKGEAVVIGEITTLMIGMFILQLIFLLIGSALAAVSKHPKTAPSRAAGVLLLTFMLSMAIDLNTNIKNLKYLTPFKYFDAKNLYAQGLEPVYLILSFVIITVLFRVTYVVYNRRDLKV